MRAFIQISNVRADGSRDCLQTVAADCKESPMAHHSNPRLTWTASGYGARIPTRHMVRFNGKWRRVYCRIYSNIGTLYIGRLADFGERLIVQIEEV